MRNRLPVLIGLSLLLLGGAVGLTIEPRRLGDASTYLLIADSLWVDGDLVCGLDDARRAEALGLAEHPRGVFLSRQASGVDTYAKPILYPVAALPFYALFGVQGFLVCNGVLFAALLWLGADILSHRLRWPSALAWSAVVLSASVVPVYVIWIDPFLICSVLIAATVAAFLRGRPGLSAVLLTAAAACRPPYLALAVAPVALCLLDRDWRSLARFAAAGAAAGVVVLGVTMLITGAWSPYAGDRIYLSVLSSQAGVPGSYPTRAQIVPGGGRLPAASAFARTAFEFAVGRFAGVLVYFPGLLICALWSRRWDRRKLAWLCGLAAVCAALILAFPHNTMGGKHALGNRLFVLLPVALVWIDPPAWSRWRAAATLALLLLPLPILSRPVEHALHAGRQMAEFPYRWLPVEWSQAARVRFPVQLTRDLASLGHAQHSWEGEGVWTRGGETATFVLLRRKPSPPPRVRLWAPGRDAAVRDGGVPLMPDWTTSGEAEIELVHPVARYVDESNDGNQVTVYTLEIESESGAYGYDLGSPQDTRYLGVYVRPLPTPSGTRD